MLGFVPVCVGAAIIVAIAWACCVVSGDCSRYEEEQEWMEHMR